MREQLPSEGDGMDTETEQSNERAQIEEVFGLTGGELMDVAWVPTYEHETWDFNASSDGNHMAKVIEQWPFMFTYWYEGLPEYAERRDTDWRDGTYRTVIADEMFGQVPETVTDDEGTWKVIARYRSSGECECPWYQNDDSDDNPAPCKVTAERAVSGECPYCGESVGEEHGYIYIGDGWSEIIYRLEVATVYVDTSERRAPSVGNSADSV